MDKKKGLADDHEGEFILNESGTSLNNDDGEGINTDDTSEPNPNEPAYKATLKTDDPIMSNDIASDEKSEQKEDIIKPFDELFPEQKAYEDMDEVSSTDDV